MKYINYILLVIAFSGLRVSILALPAPKDTSVNRSVV